jgi:hypothetical protein
MELTPPVSILRRTLVHILDSSVRPTCLREQDGRAQGSLSLEDRLLPGQLQQTLVYRTHFCCSGLGIRPLSPAELAHAFGLPITIRIGDLKLEDFGFFLPVHLLRLVLDSPELMTTLKPFKP